MIDFFFQLIKQNIRSWNYLLFIRIIPAALCLYSAIINNTQLYIISFTLFTMCIILNFSIIEIKNENKNFNNFLLSISQYACIIFFIPILSIFNIANNLFFSIIASVVIALYFISKAFFDFVIFVREKRVVYKNLFSILLDGLLYAFIFIADVSKSIRGDLLCSIYIIFYIVFSYINYMYCYFIQKK